jgi:hypothetical protein
MLHLKLLKKQEQTKAKISRRREVITTKTEEKEKWQLR